MVFIVMLRLTGLATAQSVYARREQALRSFSERLVTATEKADVWNAAVEAVVAIGAGGVIGCVVSDMALRNEEIVAATWTQLVGVAVDVTAVTGQGDRREVCFAGGGTAAPMPEHTIWTQLELPERARARGAGASRSRPAAPRRSPCDS